MCRVNAERKSDGKKDNDESLETLGDTDNEAETNGEKVKKKQKIGCYDAIQALQKVPNIDVQDMLKTAALPKCMLILIFEKETDELTHCR